MTEKNATKSRDHSATPQNIIYTYYNMNKQDLSNLTKSQQINLLLKQDDKIKLLFNKVNQLQKPVP